MRWTTRLKKHGSRQLFEAKRSACARLAHGVLARLNHARMKRALTFKEQREEIIAKAMIEKIDSHHLRLPYALDQIELFGSVVRVEVTKLGGSS
jgi:hypothetical protein